MEQNLMMNEFLIIQKYTETAVRMLQMQFPQMNYQELIVAVDYSIRKRMKNGDLYVENNYKHTKVNTTVLEMADYILSREPIITAAGVMFKKHADTINPLYNLIDEFINQRKVYKKEMFKYPKGSEQFQKYSLLQLLEKLNANALYGVIGAPTSYFYNLFIAESVTTQGQSYTKAMILAFESFLANNVLFSSLNEIIHYIDNIVNEAPYRKYKDSDIIDENITLDECFFKVMSTCGFDGYYPDERDLQIVWDLMSNLTQEDINRIFYKNNLFYFMDNASMTNMMEYMLCSLETPFMDPNVAPKEIEVELNTFWDILKEYVYYGYQYMDRMGRVDTMVRKVCIIADTDSSIISLDAWFRYNAAKYASVPMKIKRTLYEPFFEQKYDEFGDPVDMIKAVEEVEEEFDYNFFTNEEYVSGYKLAKPFIIDTQEGFTYSIINIISYCLSKMIVDYMLRYCKQTYSVSGSRDESACMIIAKNEFYFKRVMVVAQKNYCDLQVVQEGNVIPEDKQFTIMGMPLGKSVVSDYTKHELQKILYEDILRSPEINQVEVLKKICLFERKVIQSIRSGKREYFKPATVKSINNYDDPMRIFGIKATLVYNALRDNDQEALDLNSRNNIDIVEMNITIKDIPKIEEVRPDKVGAINELLSMAAFKDGIKKMALPLNESIPDWLLDFVDYTEVINSNLKIFPLEQIGISRVNSNSINYTNILQI